MKIICAKPRAIISYLMSISIIFKFFNALLVHVYSGKQANNNMEHVVKNVNLVINYN